MKQNARFPYRIRHILHMTYVIEKNIHAHIKEEIFVSVKETEQRFLLFVPADADTTSTQRFETAMNT